MRTLLAAATLLASTPAAAYDPSNGASLYFQYCAQCHGFPPLNGPESAPWNPDMIRSAIANRVARMRFLSFLADRDLADISAYLGRTLDVKPVPRANYTDLWWTAAESGWGLSVVQHGPPGNAIFGVVYTYTALGKPLWFVLPGGEWISPVTYRGELYRASGPAYDRAFDPSRVGVKAVGTLALTFTTNDTATLSYVVDAVAVEKNVTRQPY